MRSGEFARIERLRARLGVAGARGVVTAIGDDAAVLEPPAGARLVWTVDEQVEGTHFARDLVSLEDVGFRAFAAAASDLAAMGAEPWCALVALVLPDSIEDTDLDALAEGQRQAAALAGSPIVGGNLARGASLGLTTTLLGTSARPVERRGARPGDGVWLAGEVGLAAAGLEALRRRADDPRAALAVARWRRPALRIPAGLRMAQVAHAAIDVSDGLAQDAGHLARASGVRVVLEAASLTSASPDLLPAAAALGLDPIELALAGGEDYALLAASDVAIEGFARIGEVREGDGVWLRAASGEERRVVAKGFDHFA